MHPRFTPSLHAQHPLGLASAADSDAEMSDVFEGLSAALPKSERRASWSLDDINCYLLVGQGSYGKVWWARHITTGQEVSVKMSDGEGCADKTLHEYDLQTDCRHEHVARAYALLASPSKVIGVVLEQCVCSLEDAVYNAQPQQQQQQQELQRSVVQHLLDQSLQRCGSGVPQRCCSTSEQSEQSGDKQRRHDAKAHLRAEVACFSKRLHLLFQVAQGLAHVHAAGEDKRPVLHNDVRAANVLLDFRPVPNSQRREAVAKLSDFGSAVRLQHAGAGVALQKATNPMWAAPEAWWSQAHKRQQARSCCATLQSDIFSFGQLMHEVLAGVVPYTTQRPDELAEHEGRICQLVDKLWTHKEHLQALKTMRHSCAHLLESCKPELQPQLPVPQDFYCLFDSCRKLTPTKRPIAEGLRERLKIVAEQYAASLGKMQGPPLASAS